MKQENRWDLEITDVDRKDILERYVALHPAMRVEEFSVIFFLKKFKISGAKNLRGVVRAQTSSEDYSD